MAAIREIKSREVLDSRGRPTVEVEILSDTGHCGRAIAPSGASTGIHEALELRDGEPGWYGGLGVRTAVANVRNYISPLLLAKDPLDQKDIDSLMMTADGTANKSKLGANAILAVSMATAALAAEIQGIELFQHLYQLNRAGNIKAELKLPLPMVNMISGGLHAGKNLEFQDFLIYPEGCSSYSEALERIVRVYRSLGLVLAQHGETHALVGDEGGYGPNLNSNRVALDRIVEAVEKAGLTPGTDVTIALDVASSHFFDARAGGYSVRELSDKPKPAEALIAFLADLVEKYPVTSIEDGLSEDDWAGWQELTSQLGNRVQLVGDDFFTTQPARIRRGIEMQCANSVLIKLNQIGTVSETLEALKVAAEAGYGAVVSARSGETEDTFIADLATASGCGQIKIGSVTRSERLAKYNRLLRIEESLGGPGIAHFQNMSRGCRV